MLESGEDWSWGKGDTSVFELLREVLVPPCCSLYWKESLAWTLSKSVSLREHPEDLIRKWPFSPRAICPSLSNLPRPAASLISSLSYYLFNPSLPTGSFPLAYTHAHLQTLKKNNQILPRPCLPLKLLSHFLSVTTHHLLPLLPHPGLLTDSRKPGSCPTMESALLNVPSHTSNGFSFFLLSLCHS